MLVANNTPTDSVTFYQANFEHASSEANMEIQNAHNVKNFSFKSEGEWGDLIAHGGRNSPSISVWIHNSSSVHVYSHGGKCTAARSRYQLPCWVCAVPAIALQAD
jgi:hypothetical protein